MDLEKLRVFVRLTELGERVLPKASLRDSYPEVTMHLTVALTGQVEK